MPSHPDRVRKNYPECFQAGHELIVIGDSDISPYIGPTGMRVT